MTFTAISVPTVQTAVVRTRRWWLAGGQEATLHTIERGAEAFSEHFTQAMLDAIESGIIVRHWFDDGGRWLDNGGRDRIIQTGWNIARGIALFIMFVACLACAAGLASGFAACTVWRGGQNAWTLVNKAVDDGLGLYGPSPMLQEWFGSREQILLPCGTVATAAEMPADVEWAFARFGRYEGEVPEGGELVEWANSL